ncbi:ABC transporter ATP-binding protein [Niabella sp. W65]|nr:ABC transporter ATP-binding protein [Niabella sp. W65]MCH7368262.1 ABC transporter ATP-binding protein [Niabella sp. W65]
MFSIEASNLAYRFGNGQPVLNNVTLQVPQGAVYGFLGPNGAGKTTTLKLILGLIRKQQGMVKVLGKDFSQNRIDILNKVGSLIESPSVYAHLSATDNLKVFQNVYKVPQSRIAAVLDIVGLGSTGNKKAGQFSLGMKQRLAIAIALLHNPSLLILDEPTNGLDPNGIVEIREILRRLNQDQGITVLISSHLLSEIDKVATHIGLIHRGALLFEGTMSELKAKRANNAAVIYKTSHTDKVAEIFTSRGISFEKNDGSVKVAFRQKEVTAQLTRMLVQEGIDVYEVMVESQDLETIFMQTITG